MNVKVIVAAFLALAVVATGAAAAAPGNAPVDVPTDQHTDDADAAAENADENATDAGEQAEAAQAADGERGPPMDLPDQVPDFVSQIHDLIRQHVSGSLDGILGHQVSDVTPDNETDAGGLASEMAGQASSA